MYYYNGKADEQHIYILTPDRKLLGVLNGVDESTVKVTKNAQNTCELSFTVYKYHNGELSAWYDYVDELMTLYVDGIYYIIDEPISLSDDGKTSEQKDVQAESAEIQLQHYDLTNFSVGMGTAESWEMRYYNEHTDTKGTYGVEYNEYYFTDVSLKAGTDTECILTAMPMSQASVTITYLENGQSAPMLMTQSTTSAIYWSYTANAPKTIKINMSRDFDFQYIKVSYTGNDIPTVRFYNPSIPELSLLHIILNAAGLIPFSNDGTEDWVNHIDEGLWTIGEVDPIPKETKQYDGTIETSVLANASYSFEVDNQDVYSFLTQTVAQTFGCIFIFDTVNRTINAYYVEHIGMLSDRIKDTGVFIGWRNIQNELKGTRDDQLYTAATVAGGDGIEGIGYVNFGVSNIEDYSHFMNTNYVPQSLIDKYNAWVEYRETQRSKYVDTSKKKFNANSECDEITSRVPTDAVLNDWDTADMASLVTAYNNYTSMVNAYQKQYVNDNGDFDLNALKKSPDWNDYEQIVNYILPSVVNALQNKDVQKTTQLLFRIGENEINISNCAEVLWKLDNTVGDASTINVYYYLTNSSQAVELTTDKSRVLYYEFSADDNAIVLHGHIPETTDRVFCSYVEKDRYADVTDKFGTGNLFQNATFATTNYWWVYPSGTNMSFDILDDSPVYGATHELSVSNYNGEQYYVFETDIQVTSGEPYMLSFYVKSIASRDIKLWYSLRDLQEDEFDEEDIIYPEDGDTYSHAVNDVWNIVYWKFTPEGDQKEIKITVGLSGDSANPSYEICAPKLEYAASLDKPTTAFGYMGASENEIDSYQTDWKLYGTIGLQNLVDIYENNIAQLADYADVDDSDVIAFSDEARNRKLYLDYAKLRNEAVNALTERQAELKAKQKIVDQCDEELKEISTNVKRQNFGTVQSDYSSFTDEEENILKNLYKHTDYTNENIVSNDISTTDDTVEQELRLWYDATDNLYASAHPQYTWATTIDEILGIEGFKNLYQPLELFSWVHVEVEEGHFETLRLIGMEYNPCIYSGDFSLTFSTITQYKNHRDDFSKLLDTAVKQSKNSISGNKTTSEVTEYTITPEFIRNLLSRGAFASGVSSIANNSGSSNISGNTVVTKILQADEAHINKLTARTVDADAIAAKIINADSITTALLKADDVQAKNVWAKIVQADSIQTNALSAVSANFDKLLVKSSLLVQDGTAMIKDGKVTGRLDAVDINADNITSGTLTTDRLIIRDKDNDTGIIFAINNGVVSQDNLSAEELKRMTLHGSVITAQSITADKIFVSDLSAFKATIGGFELDSDAIHSFGKTGISDNVAGLYVGNSADKKAVFAIGAENGNHMIFDGDKLSLTLDSISVGSRNVTNDLQHIYYSDDRGLNLVSSPVTTDAELDALTNSYVQLKNGGLNVYAQGKSLGFFGVDSANNTTYETIGDPKSDHIKIDSDGLYVMNGTSVYSKYTSEGVMIGADTEPIGVVLNQNGLSFDTPEGVINPLSIDEDGTLQIGTDTNYIKFDNSDDTLDIHAEGDILIGNDSDEVGQYLKFDSENQKIELRTSGSVHIGNDDNYLETDENGNVILAISSLKIGGSDVVTDVDLSEALSNIDADGWKNFLQWENNTGLTIGNAENHEQFININSNQMELIGGTCRATLSSGGLKIYSSENGTRSDGQEEYISFNTSRHHAESSMSILGYNVDIRIQTYGNNPDGSAACVVFPTTKIFKAAKGHPILALDTQNQLGILTLDQIKEYIGGGGATHTNQITVDDSAGNGYSIDFKGRIDGDARGATVGYVKHRVNNIGDVLAGGKSISEKKDAPGAAYVMVDGKGNIYLRG